MLVRVLSVIFLDCCSSSHMIVFFTVWCIDRYVVVAVRLLFNSNCLIQSMPSWRRKNHQNRRPTTHTTPHKTHKTTSKPWTFRLLTLPRSFPHPAQLNKILNQSCQKEKNFLTSLIGSTLIVPPHHEELRTKKGMIDVAIWAMRQVKCHFVNDKVTANMKSNFERMLCETQKCTGTMPIFHCYKYTSAISNKLIKLQDDPGFTEKELYSRHAFAERTLHGGGNRNRSKKKMVVPNATTVPTSVYPPTASANNVDTVSTYAPSPTNKSSSTFNVLEFTMAASPSNQTVSTQVTTPPVRNITKHVDNQAPPVYMGDKLTKNYETPNRQPSSSASSSIASTSTEHDSLESKNQNGLFFRPDCHQNQSYAPYQLKKFWDGAFLVINGTSNSRRAFNFVLSPAYVCETRKTVPAFLFRIIFLCPEGRIPYGTSY